MFHFSPFSDATWKVMSFLSLGLEGHGSISISASKRGLTMKISGEKVAHGKDAAALSADFDRYMEQRRAAIDGLKADLARIEAKKEGRR